MVKRNIGNKIIQLQPIHLESVNITVYVNTDIVQAKYESEKEITSLQEKSSSTDQLQTMSVF